MSNLHRLVSEHVEKGEGENAKTSIFFTLQGWVEEKPLTREEKKAKITPTVGPVVLSKRSFSDLFGVMESIEETISDMQYPKMIRLAEKKLNPGLSLWITEQQALPENKETPEFFRAVLTSIKNEIAELDKNVSTADPDGEVKRVFCKSMPYSKLVECKNPGEVVFNALQEKINNLLSLQTKAMEVSTEDYLKFAEKKFADNSVDEDGFVMLRNTSEKTTA
jgi:hypothetical protein